MTEKYIRLPVVPISLSSPTRKIDVLMPETSHTHGLWYLAINDSDEYPGERIELSWEILTKLMPALATALEYKLKCLC